MDKKYQTGPYTLAGYTKERTQSREGKGLTTKYK